MNKRIVISGTSGVGKSTLAQHIAKTHNIPFITTSTKPLWEKHNIKDHAELIARAMADPQWGIDFQFEVLDFRREAIKGLKDYVTDRSPIDNIVYFLMQNASHAGPDITVKYLTECMELLRETTHIIYIAFTPDIVLEDDAMRVNNLHYQIGVDGVFEQIIKVYIAPDLKLQGRKMLKIGCWDWKTRCENVAKHISNLVIVKG